ncbi:uncharacterized protein EV154DRAFT_484822 [Mucor mucedo]|uniref:uncharacterized protein n=1 Tax=Mucor mucedo TaxID=29922 RepID=UPI002220C5B2|nr:uncharacterized protein EV154DRAFT_484822 [Mucor mucedo]KAI7887732.1 hypothetical protein EV154DRAFT_484822 [Mucor mucedo]
MNFHSFDKMGWNNQDLVMNASGNSLPSSWSSSSSSDPNPMIHRRAMSLRLDNLPIQQHMDMHHRASISTASPTTPAFFSPSFLDALKQDDDIMMDTSFENHHGLTDDLIHNFMMNQQEQSTITPSVINTGEVNNLTNWLLNGDSPNTTTSSSSPPLVQTNSSPSPPIQSFLQHPSIPEEEDEDMDSHEKQRTRLEIASRMIPPVPNNAIAIKPLVQKYLSTFENEQKVMIHTSKVAQKSYGTEKRFLCPPPSTLLSGTSWWTKNGNVLHPPNLVVQISGEKTSQNGVIEWYDTTTGALLDNTTSTSLASHQSNTAMSGNCVSKQLHINDADEKRKRVEVLVKIHLANGIYLGTLHSKGIKVISKPSKKRQSVKNMELCIHHGTTISLFNRIRSQTVSTKYLGVSINGAGGTGTEGGDKNSTCFVARTGSWDPFVIWIVDTTRAPDSTASANRPQQQNHHPENPHFPPAPAIALQTTTGQSPIALHYNQAIVLQCVSTGLVSPVMVIRKVDKGSMIMGGNRLDDLTGSTGGECGDEALGDPVSQLHKIAFQIVQDPSIAHKNKSKNAPFNPRPMNSMHSEWNLPQTSQAITYLACLSDVVGMHKTTTGRQFVSCRPIPPSLQQSPMLDTTWSDFDSYDILSSVVSQQENGKITRKRRVSCDVNLAKPMSLPKYPTSSTSTNSINKINNRRRVNSLNDGLMPVKIEAGGAGRRSSISSQQFQNDRRGSMSSDGGIYQVNGACWTEDVSDASVWTIVGTDCASYKFWTPPTSALADFSAPFHSNLGQGNAITPFPLLSSQQTIHHNKHTQVLNLAGENFTREITVWFGDIKAPRTDYKSRDAISCTVPEISELTKSPASMLDEQTKLHKIPILFVRADGVIYNTDVFYTF